MNEESIHGLPRDIVFCDSCVYSNQKPNSASEFRFKIGDLKTGLSFKKTTCISCLHSQNKDGRINWEQRLHQLQNLCDQYRKGNGAYDCIVPGSGGKDSFFAALILKERFGMTPLTVTWAPHIYTEWGWKNFKSWIDSGLPNYLYHPDGSTHRFLSRLALENILHPFQPFMLGQYSFPINCARNFNINLVCYGENAAEYGNKIEDNSNPSRAYQDIGLLEGEEAFIAGISLSEIMSRYKIRRTSLLDYIPPHATELAETKIDWQYMGYYLKWHPQENYYFSTGYGFEPAPQRNAGSYSRYTSLDDKLDDFNFYCMYIKYGIGRATFDASQEIKRGDITRKEAIALVARYDGEYPVRFENELFDYWSIDKVPGASETMLNSFEQPNVDRDYFNRIVDKFRSPHLWDYSVEKKEWTIKKSVLSDEMGST